MAGLLQGLGEFAGNIAPGLSQYFQNQNTAALGDALGSLYGGDVGAGQQILGQTGQQGSSMGGLGGALSQLGSVLGGQGPQQQGQQGAPTVTPPPQPPPMQQLPPPQMQQAQPLTPPGQSQPMGPRMGVPQGGMQMPQGMPQQGQPAPQTMPPQALRPPMGPPPQGSPGGGQGMPQPANPMLSQGAGQPQPQQQNRQPPPPQAPPLGRGPFDMPTLVRALTARGVRGKQLGEVVMKALPLLNASGLQAYRDVGLQIREQQVREGEARIQETERHHGVTEKQGDTRLSISQQRMEGVQKRFEDRSKAALDKLKNAKTDKDALEAKRDLDKVASDLNQELNAELKIATAPGADPAEAKAAMAKVQEIRQQLEDATNEAIKGRRGGGKAAEGGATDSGGAAAKPGDASAQPQGEKGIMYTPDGKKMKFKGTGDYNDPANWDDVSGGQ